MDVPTAHTHPSSPPHSPRPVQRLVLLGASNLTRGLPHVLAAARARWPESQLQVFVAHGNGRSFGARNRFVIRSLPGILNCGLWHRLADLPPAPTRALITDVGNDLLYGFSPGQLLDWVEACVDRIAPLAGELTLTDLPLASLDRLSPARYRLFRSLFFPGCRYSLAEARAVSLATSQGLAALARGRGLRFAPMQPEWYGFDPIHILRRHRPAAWARLMFDASAPPPRPLPLSRVLPLLLVRPERRWLFGREQRLPQFGRPLLPASRLWVY